MQNPWFHTEFLIVTDTGIKVHLSKSGEEIIDSKYKQEKKNSIITFPGDLLVIMIWILFQILPLQPIIIIIKLYHNKWR